MRVHAPSSALAHIAALSKLCFVHSYRAAVTPMNTAWVAATTEYGDGPFISVVQRGAVFASQFRRAPWGWKSCGPSLAFAVALEPGAPLLAPLPMAQASVPVGQAAPPTRLAKHIIV